MAHVAMVIHRIRAPGSTMTLLTISGNFRVRRDVAEHSPLVSVQLPRAEHRTPACESNSREYCERDQENDDPCTSKTTQPTCSHYHIISKKLHNTTPLLYERTQL